MMITREQFIRGFNALKAAQDRRARINAILNEGGDGHQDIGLDPAVRELEQQLVERCRDHEDENGPWPENSGWEGDISCGLFDPGFMTITDQQGNALPHLTTAEEIWAKWEKTKTGPFRPLPLSRYDISAFNGCDCCGAEWDAEESKIGDWVKFADVQALLSGDEA
jgi:hypothetical protein